MLSSSTFPHTINRDILSADDFESYLTAEGLLVANNLEIPAHELLICSKSDWKFNGPHGLLILFWVQEVAPEESDPLSPLGKKMIPRASGPTLHHLLDGMCGPVDFGARKVFKGQAMFAKNSTQLAV